MNRFLRAGVLGFCLCGLPGLAYADSAPDPQHPPAEAFGALPVISNPVLSPDGHHLAIIQAYHGHPVIVIYEIPRTPGKPPVILDSDEWVVTGIAWAKNDRLILTIKDNLHAIDDQLRTWLRAMSASVDGKDVKLLMHNLQDLNFNPQGALINDIALDDPDHIYMTLFIGDVLTVQKVDIHTGYSRDLVEGTDSTQQWMMDGHGQVIARVDYRPVAQTDELYIYHGHDYQRVGSFAASGDQDAGLLGLSDDGGALVMGRTDNNDMQILVRHDMTTGAETPLFSVKGYDVTTPIYDDWSERVVGAAYADDKMEYHYFDSRRQALQQGLEENYPDASVSVVSSDLAGDKVIFLVDTPSKPPGYFFLNRSTDHVSSLGYSYPKLVGVTLGEMKSYPYRAREGLMIPAYLTLPPGKPARNLPLVVMPHGGPDDRDMLGFDWWAQFLVNRGYAVLQPNYRGSSGYGHRYTEAGLKQWGLKMQDDISDGVKKVIADGIADPKRVCIVGASYGGYAALAGGAFTPELYACVVSFAGVSDLPDMLHSEHLYNGREASSFWSSRIGSIDENWDQLKITSPALHADNFRAPVLLMHGEGDTTVHIDQSEIMDNALKAAGKPVKFVRLPGSDHYLSLAETRIRVLQETEDFLNTYIGH